MREACHVVDYDSATGNVSFQNMAGATFREPTFDETALSLDRTRPASAPNTGEPLPTVLIVHTARCGSTLLCNAISETGKAIVLKEPRYLHKMIFALLAGGSAERTLADQTLRHLVDWTPPTREGQLFRVIKTTSWCAAALETLVEAIHPAMTLLVYREPAYVVASELSRPPTWDFLLDLPEEQQRRIVPDLPSPLPVEESLRRAVFYLEVWRQGIRQSAAALARGAELVALSYDDLARVRGDVIRPIMRHLGYDVEPRDLAVASEAFGVYSKTPEVSSALSPPPPSITERVRAWADQATIREQQFLKQEAPRLIDHAH